MPKITKDQLLDENTDLRNRLNEYEETLQAIRSGQVDALVIGEDRSEKLVTLTSLQAALDDTNKSRLALLSLLEDQKMAEEAVRRQLAHVRALSEIDQAVLAFGKLSDCLSKITRIVSRELIVDAVNIFVLDGDSQILEPGADCGFHTNGAKEISLRIGESLAGRVALERQPVQVSKWTNDAEGSSLLDSFTDELFVFYMGFPLIARGNVSGVLELFNRSPLDPEDDWIEFVEVLSGQVAIAIDQRSLFDNLEESNLNLILAYDETIEGWSRALDLRDKETEGHTLRVTLLSEKASLLFTMTERERRNMRWGALLHDIGKMGVPDRILLKPGPLTDDELMIIKQHPVFARKLLSSIEYLEGALDIPYCHHEKWDGTGYPQGLKGDEIPLAARIFAVIDVFDALTSDRPYRPAWSRKDTLKHLAQQSGTHFDPEVLQIVMPVLHKETTESRT